ncbi:MAG: glycosyltransferase [Chlorobiaceae bacterium]|nr:glycosyltransferase [Chlorobiaceae bacterium]
MRLKIPHNIIYDSIINVFKHFPLNNTERKKHQNKNDLFKEKERNNAENELNNFFLNKSYISFPKLKRKPKLSIIIVLFNQAGLSFLSLKTLEAINNVEYELIIVDNGSNDRVSRLLARIEGARIIRNKNNEGFIRAVNQGAEYAQGEYLLLLNDDALLFQDTLLNAVNNLENNPAVGALGGKILQWNYKLQEAGSIIWQDGSCYGYGRDDDPNKFEYNFTRKVDYCSGAFLMTRTHLFKELGGFDNDYYPAYYEDTDYCVRLWKSGHTVVYDPSVIIRHFEFGSADNKEDKAFKLQIKNRILFNEKQNDFLSHQLANNNNNTLKARIKFDSYKKCILFIDDRVPDPTLGSGYPRAQAFLKSIVHLGHFVTLLPLQFPEPESSIESEIILPDTIEVAYGVGCNGLEQFILKRKNIYDFIVVSRPHNVKELNKIIRKHPEILNSSKIVYDAEAIFSLREIAKGDVLGRPILPRDQQKMIAAELSLYQYANKIVTVSDRERQYYIKSNFPHVNILGHSIEKVNIPTKSFYERFGFLFVGTIQSDESPNGDSLIWFLNYVWPLIIKKNKNAQLNIVGLCESSTIYAHASNNVIFHGRINKIAHFYENARVFIAPTRFSAGIPHKAHEAGAYGLPIIATPIITSQLGWEGIILSGDSPQEFADHCVMLHESSDIWAAQQASLFNKIETDCNPKLFQETVQTIFS